MLKLTFTGDIFPGDEEFTIGFGIKSKFEKGCSKLWINNIPSVVGESDFLIGNLESPLIDKEDSVKATFFGTKQFASFLHECGFNVLNIANNHILEQGDNGYYRTLTNLKNYGIDYVGGTVKGRPQILLLNKNNISVAISAFCDERVCNIPNKDCYASLEESSVVHTLERMNEYYPDYKIFIFHWGNEYISFPSPEQRNLAYKLIDNGADIIIGHHPHCIQPYEKYKNGHIFYSLGNFCFDGLESKKVSVGMTVSFDLDKKNISDVQYRGVRLFDTYTSDELVKPMKLDEFRNLFNKINDRYRRLQQFDELQYSKLYKRSLKKKHLQERILMKTNLVKKVMTSDFSVKKMLLSNIFKFYK